MSKQLYLAVPGAHPLADRADVRLGDVATERFVMLRRPSPLRDLIEQLCGQAGFEPELAFEAEDLPTVSKALVPRSPLRRHKAPGQRPDGGSRTPLVRSQARDSYATCRYIRLRQAGSPGHLHRPEPRPQPLHHLRQPDPT